MDEQIAAVKLQSRDRIVSDPTVLLSKARPVGQNISYSTEATSQMLPKSPKQTVKLFAPPRLRFVE